MDLIQADRRGIGCLFARESFDLGELEGEVAAEPGRIENFDLGRGGLLELFEVPEGNAGAADRQQHERRPGDGVEEHCRDEGENRQSGRAGGKGGAGVLDPLSCLFDGEMAVLDRFDVVFELILGVRFARL